MTNLKYPNMREELVGHLKVLIRTRSGESWRQGDLDYVVHFLFDDTPRPAHARGYYLNSDDEVQATQALVHAIDTVLHRYGTKLQDTEYFSKPEWDSVVSGAQAALDVLLKGEGSRQG
jgi:hypothetical protein